MGDRATANSTAKSWLYHPRFPEHWHGRPLYSLARWVNGLAFRNIQFSPTGKPVIKIAEIKGGISGQTKFTQQTFDESVHVRPGDLLFSWSGQPETSIDAFWWRGPDGWLNQHVFRVTPVDRMDTTFFYYLLRCLKPNFVGIARNKQTTGLGHITKRDLENVEAAFPDLPEQRAIAHMLGTLDDKIELNRRMNETLEAMARAIFKSWFVDFDPVRAKMEGRQPSGMDAETAALFPDSFQDSRLGKIPKGWRIGKLSDLCTTQYGYTASASEEPVGPKFLRVKDINKTDWIEWSSVPYCKISEVDSRKYALAVGDVVVARMADPGKSAIVEEAVDAVFASYLVRLKAKSVACSYFVYGFLTSADYEEYSQGAMGGSVQKNMNARVIVAADMVIPPQSVIEGSLSVVLPLRQRISANLRESSTLAVVRDTLLPRLLSGELRVTDWSVPENGEPDALAPDSGTAAKHEDESEEDRSSGVTEQPSPPSAIEEIETDEIMAMFRQVARGYESMEREELLKEVSVRLGYRRFGSRIEEALRGHLRAAIRRKIIGTDGPGVWLLSPRMTSYTRDELVETLQSVMRKSSVYEREEVIRVVANHLGFRRLNENMRKPVRSAINAAIRRGLLGYEGSKIWRVQ